MRRRLGWLKSIRAQLLLGFGTILMVNCLSAAIGYSSLQRLRSSTQTALDNAARIQALTLKLETHFLKARQAEETYLNNWRVADFSQNAQHYIDANQRHLNEARNNLTVLRTIDTEQALADELTLLDSLFNNYQSAFDATTSRIAEAGSGYQLYQQLQRTLSALTTEVAFVENATIQRLLWELVVHEQAYFNTGDQQYVNDVRASLDQLTRLLTDLDAETADPRLNILSQEHIDTLNDLLLLNQQVRVNTIIAENIHQEIDRTIQAISQTSSAQATQARLELAQTARHSSVALLATAISAFILAVGASIWLGRRILTPLTELSETAGRIAQGDLNRTLSLPGDNEFSIVAAAFNNMMSQLRQTLEHLEQRIEARTQALQAQAQSLESALRQLRRSETHYRQLIDHLHAGVIVYGADRRVVMGNQTAWDMLGLTADAVSGDETSIWTLIDEFGTPLQPEHYPVRQVIASQIPLQNYVVGICRSSQQNCLWVLVNAFPSFDDAHQLTQVVVTFIDITDRKLAEEELRHQAMHDALTELPNRALFNEHLDRALRRTQRHPQGLFAVLFIDLDRFKVINDSLGHLIGDQLLIQVANILKRHVRTSDTVARLGGDEFVILLEPIASLRDAIQVVERIQADMKLPIRLGEHTVFTSASIGIALSNPHYASGEAILRDADNAMYCAKGQGPSCYEIFNPEMHQSALQLFELETGLRRAIEQQEFVLHYQPIVSLTSCQLLGFEALVRWMHPRRGLIPPNEFIPLAEETGLIMPLGEWILQAACQQMVSWQQRFPAAGDLKLSVNVAAAQFCNSTFLASLSQTLTQANLSPDRLKLEVTESLLLANVEAVLSTFSKLQQQHIEISIDDFGAGYSSLSYLKQFPINTLKIDKSFVDGLGTEQEDTSLIEAIIQIAQSLRLSVVAEGVETTSQREQLRQLGCDAIQGYLVAPPLTSRQATDFIGYHTFAASRSSRQG